MSENTSADHASAPSFFERPSVQQETLPVGGGIPFGFERVANPELGIGGVYGAWGESYDNAHLKELVEQRLGEPLEPQEVMNLAELGFICRHHIRDLSAEDHLEVEVEVGSRLLREAALANGWQTSEVQAVLIGMSGPVAPDYVERIAARAGVPPGALKVSIHKACDSSMGGLNLALNPGLAAPGQMNIAEELYGKKTLVGGIEGLSRFTRRTRDKNALQLFGNGAGVIGLIPGQTMKFLVGAKREAFDEQGVLAVRMYYPHSHQGLLEVTQSGQSVRVAGLMHEPQGESPIDMAGPMGMVKLFVRTGVEVVSEVYQAYCRLMEKLGTPDRSIAVAIVHHANYKINQLKEKHLKNLGIQFPMPWLISDFGNVSAASNMIAFLRQLPKLKLGDHVLFDGFGAGTYYDVLAVAMG